MRKLVFFSAIASPHWVRFNPHLRTVYDAEFYFYERSAGRQSFWEVPLGEHCHVLGARFSWKRRYCTLAVLKVLREENPDIVLLGGFSVPSNYLAYLWAKRHKRRVVVITERSRVRATGKPRPYDWKWKLLHWLYHDVDQVMVTASDIAPQFRDDYKFGSRVVVGQYPADIDRYYSHPVRGRKDTYTLIFANRLTDIYNPLAAVRIFSMVRKRHVNVRMRMNATGELRADVEAFIGKLGLKESVEFLDGIKSWDDLGNVYKTSDIMLLPAKYSNGNYTIFECMVSGMACIVSENVLGTGPAKMRAIGAGRVLPLDEGVFTDAICEYIENPTLFADDARKSREGFSSLTMSGTARLYGKLFEEFKLA